MPHHLTQSNSDTTIHITEPGEHVYIMNHLSGKFVFSLDEPGVSLKIYGMYDANGKEKYSLELLQIHNAPKTTSSSLIKTIAKDSSQFLFSGTIVIEKHASGADARLENRNLILSGSPFIQSKPELEILTKEVKCSHGVTTGRVSEDELYYMATRGVSEQEATKAIAEGFLEEIREISKM